MWRNFGRSLLHLIGVEAFLRPQDKILSLRRQNAWSCHLPLFLSERFGIVLLIITFHKFVINSFNPVAILWIENGRGWHLGSWRALMRRHLRSLQPGRSRRLGRGLSIQLKFPWGSRLLNRLFNFFRKREIISLFQNFRLFCFSSETYFCRTNVS